MGQINLSLSFPSGGRKPYPAKDATRIDNQKHSDLASVEHVEAIETQPNVVEHIAVVRDSDFPLQPRQRRNQDLPFIAASEVAKQTGAGGTRLCKPSQSVVARLSVR